MTLTPIQLIVREFNSAYFKSIESRWESKKAKDIETVKSLLIYVHASNKSSEELKTLYDSLPKTWKKKIDKTVKENDIVLFD